MPEDLGLNQWLKEHFGTTIDGKPLFRIIFSTGVTEKRLATFQDYLGEIFLREVREVRDCLCYPFAQDRWILERLVPLEESSRKIVEASGLVGVQQVYNDIYIFQDKKGDYLPLNRDKLEAAMYLYIKFYLQMTPKERIDFRMEQSLSKWKTTKESNRDMIGDSLRSPLFANQDVINYPHNKKKQYFT